MYAYLQQCFEKGLLGGAPAAEMTVNMSTKRTTTPRNIQGLREAWLLQPCIYRRLLRAMESEFHRVHVRSRGCAGSAHINVVRQGAAHGDPTLRTNFILISSSHARLRRVKSLQRC